MELIPSICPNCKTPLPVPYRERGVAKWCNTCLHETVPIVPVGSSIQNSGNSLTYSSFRSLIEDSDREQIGKLLKSWFNFEISGNGRDDTLIVNDLGQAIDPVWLHRKIQADDNFKGEIYNLAMTIWHS